MIAPTSMPVTSAIQMLFAVSLSESFLFRATRYVFASARPIIPNVTPIETVEMTTARIPRPSGPSARAVSTPVSTPNSIEKNLAVSVVTVLEKKFKMAAPLTDLVLLRQFISS